MRVPDSVCNTAIKASRLFGKLGRRGPSEPSGTTQGFTLFQVLEGYDGKKIYRFDAPQGFGPLAIKDARGHRIPFEFVALEANSPRNPHRKLFSVALPSSVGTFWISSPNVAATRIGRLETRALEIKRNCLMVNPAIDSAYPQWLKRHEGEQLAGAPVEGSSPKFSIITPLFNTPVDFFAEMVGSVLAQTYGNWELVLVNASPQNEELRQALDALDDERIIVVNLEKNGGISENTVEGIKASSGDYLSFLDHDDTLEPNALAEYAQAISQDSTIDLLYCDEDSITHDGTKRFKPLFKPDFNKDLLLSHNYVCHWLTVSKWAYDQVEPYDSSVDGAQDYDLTLKVSRVARGIKHVPKILYHWRQHAGSTNGGSTEVKPYVIDASFKALSGYLREDGIDAEIVPTDIPCVFEEVYPHFGNRDVSAVIVYQNGLQLLECLDSLSEVASDVLGEVVAVGPAIDVVRDLMAPLGVESDDGDRVHQAAEYLTEVAGRSVKLIEMEAPSFPVTANAGIEHACKEYVLLVDADVRFDQGDTPISLLRDCLCREDVGIASAKILSADGLVYHAGLCVKDDGSFGYLNQGFIEGMGGGYHGCAECSCEYSAVDPSCILFRKSDFESAGGFCEDYEDQLASGIDLSFKMRELGKRNVVFPQARVSIKPIGGRWDLGKSYIAPGAADHELLWHTRDERYKRDILSHPDVDLSSSYFRLKV